MLTHFFYGSVASAWVADLSIFRAEHHRGVGADVPFFASTDRPRGLEFDRVCRVAVHGQMHGAPKERCSGGLMNRKQVSVQDLFAALGLVAGDELVIEGRGGWEMLVVQGERGADFTHQNPIMREGLFVGYGFYAYTTCGNPYGAGIMNEEPTLGVSLASCGASGDGKLVGAIVIDDDIKLVDRYSWSNHVYRQGKTFSVAADGALVVDGKQSGWLTKAVLANKNRIGGFVGVFTPNKPDHVRLLELEQVVLENMKLTAGM